MLSIDALPRLGEGNAVSRNTACFTIITNEIMSLSLNSIYVLG